MQTLFYILITLSTLLGIGVGCFGVLLGWMLKSSFDNSDQVWGWAVIFFSLLYLAHPALVYWLFKNTHEILAMGLSALFITFSIGLLFFLPSAIGAVARP
jgi:hypothetical protein